MIERYARPEMEKLWAQENKYRRWLDVELAVCEAYAEDGEIPAEAMKAIRERADFDIGRIDEIEQTTRHDVIAFLTAVGEKVGPESRYIHVGLTSSDVLDTAFALQLRDAADIIIGDLEALLEVLKETAFEHRGTVMIGRSHGIHAEPITFGMKIALWFAEMERNLERVRRAREAIRVGKISGAVGTFANVPPSVEARVCESLGLRPAPVSSQVVQRDRHAEFFGALAITAGTIEKIAVEIRHLQRTEVLEAEEPFRSGQKGSSAMPHKRNPILSENLTGLARLVRSYAAASLENIALWHERDISHSSVERVIGPDATILADFMLGRLTRLIRGLVVYPENMEKNLWLTGGLIFSQQVMLELVRKGMSREAAYACVQRCAMAARREGESFKSLLLGDPEVTGLLDEAALDEILDPGHHLKHIDTIFQRVFGGRESQESTVESREE